MPINNIEPKISDELRSLLNDLTEAANNTCDLVNRIYRQGIRDGLTKNQIRNLIRSCLTRLSDRTIRRYLPEDVKAKTVPGKKVAKLATYDTQIEKQRREVLDQKFDTKTHEVESLQDIRDKNAINSTPTTNLGSFKDVPDQKDVDIRANTSLLLSAKDKLIEALQKELKEKDVRIQQLDKQKMKLEEQSRWLVGGNRRFKAVVNQVWRELMLLKHSGVIYMYVWCNGDSFTRLEPI
jgi:predicted RNase H-like nuclease (RuvC/YqgF family)